MKKFLVLLFICFSSVVNAASPDIRPEVANNVIAFDGQQGAKVWTLRIGPVSNNESLVQVEGVDHDWNLLIQKMKVEKTSKDTRYVTNVKGKRFVALILTDKDYGELYLPNDPQPIQVRYSENLSEQGNAQAFLTDYLQKKK